MIFSSNKFEKFNLQDTILRKQNLPSIQTEPSALDFSINSKKDSFFGNEKFVIGSPTHSNIYQRKNNNGSHSINKPIKSFDDFSKNKKFYTENSKEQINLNESSFLMNRRYIREKESPNISKFESCTEVSNVIDGLKKKQMQMNYSKKLSSSNSLILPQINCRSPRTDQKKKMVMKPVEENPVEEYREKTTAKFLEHLKFLKSKNYLKESNIFPKKLKTNSSVSSGESESEEETPAAAAEILESGEKQKGSGKKNQEEQTMQSVNPQEKKKDNKAARRGLFNPENFNLKKNEDNSRRVGIAAVRESQNIVKALRKSEIGVYNEIYSVTKDLSANIQMMNEDVSNKRKSFLLLKKFSEGLHAEIKDSFLNYKKEEVVEPITQEILENICFVKEPFYDGAFVFYKESFDITRLNDFKELNKRVTEFNIKRKIEELRNMERQITEEFVEVKRIEDEMRKKDVKRFFERYRPLTRLKYQSMGAGQKIVDGIEDFEVHFGDIKVVPLRGRSISKELDTILYSVSNKLKHATEGDLKRKLV